MFWSCPQLSEIWPAIFDTLSEVLGKTVDPNPLAALFRIPSMPNAPKAQHNTLLLSPLYLIGGLFSLN